MPLYLFQFDNQPRFYWDLTKLSRLLGAVRFRQGILVGKMEGLGDPGLIRQDAAKHYGHALSEEQLLRWHGGSWRNAGPAGIGKVHASSPGSPVLRAEIRKFLSWFNRDEGIDPVLKAAVAHLWFLVIRPFDKGNEQIAQLITDMQLSRADQSARRYYSMSEQISREGAKYEELVNKARQGAVEITDWLEWFLDRLDLALAEAEQGIAGLMKGGGLPNRYSRLPLSERQRLIIHKLLDGVETSEGSGSRISSSQWARIAGCSQDTALRDIQDLMGRSILVKEPAGGRSTQYILKP